MELYGLIGYPLGHSFSAKFFAEKFKTEGIDAEYRNFEIKSAAELLEIVKKHPNLKGLNVTIPYKKDVIPLLDDLSEEARQIGAVNVISIKRADGQRPFMKGYNSDIIGFMRSISPLLKPWHKKALVLGTGGASLAVIHGLEKLGIDTTYVSRTPKAGRLTYGGLSAETMEEYKLIVNCTPLGMYPKTNACPDIPYESIGNQHLLYDLVYNPEETLFLKKGKDHGATIKNGLEMLHLQALAGWEFWHKD